MGRNGEVETRVDWVEIQAIGGKGQGDRRKLWRAGMGGAEVEHRFYRISIEYSIAGHHRSAYVIL
jgi:hypothetical protein